jgi:hypothetical protein
MQSHTLSQATTNGQNDAMMEGSSQASKLLELTTDAQSLLADHCSLNYMMLVDASQCQEQRWWPSCASRICESIREPKGAPSTADQMHDHKRAHVGYVCGVGKAADQAPTTQNGRTNDKHNGWPKGPWQNSMRQL